MTKAISAKEARAALHTAAQAEMYTHADLQRVVELAYSEIRNVMQRRQVAVVHYWSVPVLDEDKNALTGADSHKFAMNLGNAAATILRGQRYMVRVKTRELPDHSRYDLVISWIDGF